MIDTKLLISLTLRPWVVTIINSYKHNFCILTCACAYAVVFFVYFQRTNILPKFYKNLLLYVRYIDGIFIVWKDLPKSHNTFEEFQNCLKSQCKLEWKTEKLNTRVDFLDLIITLDRCQGRCITRTFQKPMNLHLYINAHSSQPPGLT